MPQVSLYLDDATMEKLREDAKRERLSLSKYTAKLIKEHNSAAGWSDRFWETYGSLKDADFSRPIQPDWSLDAPRKALVDNYVSA